MAIIPDWINPEAPLTPKKHLFVLNFLESDLCDSAINPLWDNGDPISGSSGKSQNPGCFFNNSIKPFGNALPLLCAGKKRDFTAEEIRQKVSRPAPGRLFAIYDAFCSGYRIDEIHQLSGIDPWFLAFLQRLALIDYGLNGKNLRDIDENAMNDFFEKQDDTILDFSENNPFGDIGKVG